MGGRTGGKEERRREGNENSARSEAAFDSVCGCGLETKFPLRELRNPPGKSRKESRKGLLSPPFSLIVRVIVGLNGGKSED
jgi:hypothetical protein